MKTHTTKIRRALAFLTFALVLSGTACGTMMAIMHGGPDRPPAAEFGLGPRTSSAGLYTVSLEPVAPLAKRKLQVVRVRVLDAHGKPVDDATMLVGGGMPQHGHGLPTKPRMTGRIDAGLYEIGGVRFNMGGWWEFKLAIRGSAGTDSVTFNIQL